MKRILSTCTDKRCWIKKREKMKMKKKTREPSSTTSLWRSLDLAIIKLIQFHVSPWKSMMIAFFNFFIQLVAFLKSSLFTLFYFFIFKIKNTTENSVIQPSIRQRQVRKRHKVQWQNSKKWARFIDKMEIRMKKKMRRDDIDTKKK